MKRSVMSVLAAEDLVARFLANSLGHEEAELDFNTRKVNRLLRENWAIAAELKTREGDQRSALLILLRHNNIRVRLDAAMSTIAVAPEEARFVLKEIAQMHVFPETAEAQFAIDGLDSGEWNPT